MDSEAGRSVNFFIVCPPGLENDLKSELLEFWPLLLNEHGQNNCEPFEVVQEVNGGLEIQCSALSGYQINFFSKMASRVLQRVGTFKARDFPKLHQGFKKINWSLDLGAQKFLVQAEASSSRLNNEKRILETAVSAWPLAVIDKKEVQSSVPTVMIRVFQDEVSVSLDTTGRHLHFRNSPLNPKLLGEAPLRETLAAWMIRRLIEVHPLSELQQVTLWDPMAGSGTLIEEALKLHSPNSQREFAFQNFKRIPKILKTESFFKNYSSSHLQFHKLKASDSNPKMLPILHHNLKPYGVEIFQHEVRSDSKQSVQHDDRIWMICNPPYNQRLQNKQSPADMAQVFLQYQAEKYGFLIPQNFVSLFQECFSRSYKVFEPHRISNGGISVAYVQYQRLAGR